MQKRLKDTLKNQPIPGGNTNSPILDWYFPIKIENGAAVPPIGASGDGADARTPEAPGVGYSNNVPMTDNYAPPISAPAGWMRKHGKG